MSNPVDVKFLVIHPERTMRSAICSLLGQIGYVNVAVAEDGAFALEMLKSNRYDFVVSGINMPHKDGLSLLRDIRRDDKLSHLPVLIVSSAQDTTIKDKAMRYGATCYIVTTKTGAGVLLQQEVVRIMELQTSSMSS